MSDSLDRRHEPELPEGKEFENYPDGDEDNIVAGDDPEYRRTRLPAKRKQPRLLPPRRHYDDY